MIIDWSFFEILNLGPSCMMNYFVWKVNGVGIHLVWKWDVCCPLVSRLKIDHAMWCVCWSVTHVFALYCFQLLKDPYFEWAYLSHFSTIWCDLSGYGWAQSWFTKHILKRQTSQTLDWLLFCSECLSVWWPAWLPYIFEYFFFQFELG
jgi:hypothetical protein